MKNKKTEEICNFKITEFRNNITSVINSCNFDYSKIFNTFIDLEFLYFEIANNLYEIN